MEVVATITKNSVDRLQLAEGKEVSAIVKATDVMIATNELEPSSFNPAAPPPQSPAFGGSGLLFAWQEERDLW